MAVSLLHLNPREGCNKRIRNAKPRHHTNAIDMIMIGQVRLSMSEDKSQILYFIIYLTFRIFQKPLQGSLFNFDLFIATVGESLHQILAPLPFLRLFDMTQKHRRNKGVESYAGRFISDNRSCRQTLHLQFWLLVFIAHSC